MPGRLARKRRGFGTAWLERTFPRELGAAAKQECDPRGLRWVIELPLTERITMRKRARHRVKNENDLSQRVAISARGPHRDALSGMRCVLPKPGKMISSTDRRNLLLYRPLPPDANASLTHIPELYVHHGCHQGIVEGVVLPESWNAQVRQD